MMPYGYGYGVGAWGWAMMIGMALFWVLGLVALGFIIWWATGRGGAGRTPPGGRETPLEILQRRYAHGEITAEQYREMKRELGAGGAAPA